MTPRLRVDPPTHDNASEVLERLAQEVSQLAFHVQETVNDLRSDEDQEGAVNERTGDDASVRGGGDSPGEHESA